MILEEHFRPLNKKDIPKPTHNDNWVTKAMFHYDKIPELEPGSIAIIGITENDKDTFPVLVRKELYTYSKSEYAGKIIDLGDFTFENNTKNAEKLAFILSELHEKEVCPVLISSSQEVTYCQYLAFDFLKKIINMAVIDSRIDFSLENQASFDQQNFLHKILLKDPSYLFNLSFIGYQSYFTNTEVVNFMSNYYFDMYRLGLVRENIKDIEPIIRSADIINFDLSSIRHADASAVLNSSPNGLYAEEACKLARYAGLSDTTSSLSITSFDKSNKDVLSTASLVAQMIWFFAEGYYSRDDEIKFRNENTFIKYITSEPNNPYEITFYKSIKTNRWWMEIPIDDPASKYKSKQIIPCSYTDYELATQGEIPDRWYKAMKKL